MAAKSDYLSNALLQLLFNATSIPNLADDSGTGPLTDLWVALHTATPGPTGLQDANEAAYSGYARVSVARTGAEWAVSGDVVNPVNPITFPVAGAGPLETETFFSIGVASSGVTEILYFGPITPTIAVTVGIIPQLTVASYASEA
jgi:hypothetical protein